MWNVIAQHITQATGTPFSIQDQRRVGGGGINQAFQIAEGDRKFFLKLNRAAQLSMFEAEALGLKEIADSNTIRVPRPICWGSTGDAAYVVMEWLDLGNGNQESWYRMGQDLAAMHRVTSERKGSTPQGHYSFGWQQDNTIGDTPQKNPWTADWQTFYLEHRLRFQFNLARRRGGCFPQEAALLAAVPTLLMEHDPIPSLVHGDLWSGNAAVTQSGEPVIFDPATYYGDREVDVAMTELFGQFPQAFYDGYHAAYPLEPGYEQRKVLYNLYHILNHFNLFGGGYSSQANHMMAQLLK